LNAQAQSKQEDFQVLVFNFAQGIGLLVTTDKKQQLVNSREG